MMTMRVQTITPQTAKEWLENNMNNNRKINHSRVAAYARTMASGEWNLTHQGIAFDEFGMLIDGQHRLMAIVRANVAVEMVVTTGVRHKNGELLNIDVGYRRTDANLLQISGINDPVRRDMAPVIRSWWYHKKQGRTRPTQAEVQDYITRHYKDVSNLYELSHIRKHSTSSNTNAKSIQSIVCAALLGAMYRGLSDDAIIKFCNVYRNNKVNDCDNYNASICLNLRDYVRATKNTDPKLFSYIENSIRAFAANNQKVRIKEDCYPYIAEFDA